MLTLPRIITYALVAAALSCVAVHPESVTTEPHPFHRLVTSGGIKLYQKLISPARGSSCPMHPHCSEYSRVAFQDRNPLQAYLMTADRLMRCGHDLDQYSPTVVDGYLRYSDSVDEERPTGGAFSTGSSSDNQIVEEGVSQGAVTSVGEGDSDSTQPDELLFRFAIQLHNGSEHDRAITEYRRLMAYYPNSPYRLQAEPLLVRCYYEAGLYSKAFDFGERLLDNRPQVATADQIRFTLGAAGLRSRDHGQAQAYFGQVAAGDSDLREKAVLAQGLTYAHQYDWETAALTFASLTDDSKYAMKARYCERLCREGAVIRYKNRHLAGVLAIVPGLGYLYDGYYQSALSAFVVNGLFMWGTYEAFRQKHPGLGVTLALFEIGWYAGNIFGSVTSATRSNAKSRQDLLLRFDIGYVF